MFFGGPQEAFANISRALHGGSASAAQLAAAADQ
jgi:hypothetical protein